MRDRFINTNHGAKPYKLVMLLLALTAMYTPASKGQSCIGSVKGVFDEMKAKSSGDKVSYLKYSVTAILSEKNDGANITNSSTFQVMNTNKKSRLYSKEMIVFRDTVNTFNIIVPKRLIYWSKSQQLKNSDDVYTQLRSNLDSLFNHTKKVECLDVAGMNYNKSVTVILDTKMANHLQIEKVNYCIDESNKTLIKVEVTYLPNNQFIKVTYNFLEQSFDYKKEDLNSPVISLVFTDGGKILQQKYAGFEIIDTRKQ